jgi:nucleotide-binding universal stress UspA family protein
VRGEAGADVDRVLVAIDFSPVSATAVRWAKCIACEGTLRLFHVADTTTIAPETSGTPSVALLDLEERLEEAAERELAALAARECLEPGRFELDVAFGNPAEEIVRVCGEDQVALAVLGVRPRGALERLTLGSVAEEVALGNPAPTLLVRGDAGDGCVERVLAAVDLSAPSIEALVAALHLARGLGATLVPVNVVELPAAMSRAAAARAIEETRRVLEAFVAGTLERAIPVTVLEGSAATTVVRHAAPRDLIVCGTHGRHLPGRAFMGSVAARIVRHAPCPVVVVRPREEPPAA